MEMGAIAPFIRRCQKQLTITMITKLSKLLAIFVTVASLAFVGFAMATVFGGPDWKTEMNAEYFDGYTITKSSGPDGTWTATRASDEGSAGSSKALPEVLTKVMDEVAGIRTQKLSELAAQEAAIQKRIDDLKGLLPNDEAGVATYIAGIRERLSAARKQEADVAAQVIAATNESQKIESQVANRRDDVLRLQEQVAELKADIFRLEEIEVDLVDRLNQIRGSLELASERQNRLDYSPAPVAP